MRVAELLLAAQAARALVDVEWYCYEASNVVNASLADLSVAGGVNFTYYPVNHVNATSGAFECARKIARFLACFEGPYANREVNVNASRREPCFREAGLDFAPAAMMARLGASPGLFPHIFVDGKPLVDRTWTALTRAICGALPAAPPSVCDSVAAPRLVFAVAEGSCARARPSTRGRARRGIRRVEGGVSGALRDGRRRAAAGRPSYVDVRAATRASCAVADAAATCSYEVLGAFRGAVDQARRDGGFEAGLVYGLRHAAGLDADVAVRAC
ncbi:hypothetical protein JL721_8460 [Aureococcus anophagefferens]|nr:hypothetical protein JL721_8460 [Aureococcus anophagefferens]